MRRNVVTSLRLRHSRRSPMEAYDLAPPELRRWLADAALPWSPEGATRRYARALRRCRGDRDAALAELSARAEELLAADVSLVWGPAHPQARPPAKRPMVRWPRF